MDSIFTRETDRRRENARVPATRCCYGLLNLLRVISTSGRCDLDRMQEFVERMVRVHGLIGEDRQRFKWFTDHIVMAYMGKMALCHRGGRDGLGCGECLGCREAYQKIDFDTLDCS